MRGGRIRAPSIAAAGRLGKVLRAGSTMPAGPGPRRGGRRVSVTTPRMSRRPAHSAVAVGRDCAGLPPLVPIARDCAYDPGSSLFVLSRPSGYETRGLDYARRANAAVRAWAGLPKRPTATPAEAWASYAEAMRLGAEYADRTRTQCPADLTPSLVGLEGRRVAIHVPGAGTRRFNVGRSVGWCPVHLEIARRGCIGGRPACVPDGARVEVIR